MKFPRKIAGAFFLIIAFVLLLQFYLLDSELDVDKELSLKMENASATYEGYGFENAYLLLQIQNTLQGKRVKTLVMLNLG